MMREQRRNALPGLPALLLLLLGLGGSLFGIISSARAESSVVNAGTLYQ